MKIRASVQPIRFCECFTIVLLIAFCALQTPAQDSGRRPCQGSDSAVADGQYLVKEIRIRPLLRFIPTSAALEQALSRAIKNQSTGVATLVVDKPFTATGVAMLESLLTQELLASQLNAKSGLIYAHHKLLNCDETTRTMVVEYQVLVVARPSYSEAAFEVHKLGDSEKGEKQAGTLDPDNIRLKYRPYVNYNRTRGIFGGTSVALEKPDGLINKLQIDASGSESDVAADASLAGSRQLSNGIVNYIEWRLGYTYTNVPAETLNTLKAATVRAQFFGATRSLGPHSLFLRFGASAEGGYRQTDPDPGVVASSDMDQVQFRAAKLYVGASFTSSRHDFKTSYGLQLANNGRGRAIDYKKHIFDAAYSGRFLLRDYRPLQVDAQFTAGLLDGAPEDIPLVERFFGGNVEQPFIQGDSWTIRSNPFIRSFAENRLNRVGSGQPIGGENFVAANVTISHVVWNRQLMPREIVRDPDVTSGLGGQLLSTRLFLREEAVQSSKQIKHLQISVEDFAPAVSALKGELAALQANRPSAAVMSAINNFAQPCDSCPDSDTSLLDNIEAAVAATRTDPNAPRPVLEDSAAIAQYLNNAIEFNAKVLVQDDRENEVTSLLTRAQDNLVVLNRALIDAGAGTNSVDRIASSLQTSKQNVLSDLVTVDRLRTYEQRQLQPAIDEMNRAEPSSGRRINEILTNTRTLLAPLMTQVSGELEALPADSTDETVQAKRAELIEYQERLNAADTYANKAADAFDSANDFYGRNQFVEVKPDIERLVIGFGKGVPSYITGLEQAVDNLKQPLAARSEMSLWNTLKQNSSQLDIVTRNVRGKFGRIQPPQAEGEANKTVAYVGRVLGVFFRELNLIAVSPTVMFDAARLGGRAPGNARFRYGIGGGLTFTLVNLDLTAGYSLNPNPIQGERRGAFVFGLKINDLFR